MAGTEAQGYRQPPAPGLRSSTTEMFSSNSVVSSSGKLRTTGSPRDYRRRRGRFRGSRRKGQAGGAGLGLALAPSTLAVLAFCNSEFDAHFERVWSFFCRELCTLFFPLWSDRRSKPAQPGGPNGLLRIVSRSCAFVFGFRSSRHPLLRSSSALSMHFLLEYWMRVCSASSSVLLLGWKPQLRARCGLGVWEPFGE